MKNTFLILFNLLLICCNRSGEQLRPSGNDLVFHHFASTWDEGIPLGNGIVGALIWEKDEKLRLSLDCVDLWDERPMVNRDSLLTRNFKWVEKQVLKKDYKPVQLMYDVPYDTSAYPTKIPGGALEFEIKQYGKVNEVRLFLNNALCKVTWDKGVNFYSYVHATEPLGWFRFENIEEGMEPILLAPNYENSSEKMSGQDIRRLGYKQGVVLKKDGKLVYTQQGWENFNYEIVVNYQRKGTTLEGVWSISTSNTQKKAEQTSLEASKRGFDKDFKTHQLWWDKYWSQSSVNIPDSILEKQYYNEMYKFGSTARSYSPPISLQAVWTADNGQLPPWKGDYHHDLNTQLSYWPCYAGNHLEEGEGYLNWLWKVRETNKAYTKEYFGLNGLAVPGVTTLKGEPMAGWIQYSLGTTVSAWLSQHFYLQWKYSADEQFLKDRAYPYIKDVAVFLDELAVRDADNNRKFPISSSPEIYDNSIHAWFFTNTNYDLALAHFVYSAASEMASTLKLNEEAEQWKRILNEWPDFDLDTEKALTFAKGFPYNESHRHFSNAMAIHPLGLIDVSQGEESEKIIRSTLHKLDSIGPDYWCGYSYSWLGNIKARALDGDGAADALRIFAKHFCLSNTFHANGDQTKQGFSKFTYRPFTLEGNFAFASAIHEMLLQSHTGIITVFPALPKEWKDVAFNKLRAVGAFLVSAKMKEGQVKEITVLAEKRGNLRLKHPFNSGYKCDNKKIKEENGILQLQMEVGEKVILYSTN